MSDKAPLPPDVEERLEDISACVHHRGKLLRYFGGCSFCYEKMQASMAAYRLGLAQRMPRPFDPNEHAQWCNGLCECEKDARAEKEPTMNDELLNSEQCIQFDHAILHTGCTSRAGEVRREIEHAVVAALAARGAVGVDRIATAAAIDCEYANRTTPTPKIIADALRTALAQQAAKYEEREAKWVELDALCRENGPIIYERALRRELGLGE